LIDNGLIEIKQQGAYAKDNSHEILAKFNNSYVLYPFFSINDSQINIIYRDNGKPKQLNLNGFKESNTEVKNGVDNASFLITRENEFFILKEEITVFSGTQFAKVSLDLESKFDNLSFDWLHFPFQSRGIPLQYPNSIAVVDNTMHLISQIILPDGQLGKNIFMQENPDFYELVYNLEGKKPVEANFYVGFSQFQMGSQTNQIDYLNKIIENNTQTYQTKQSDLPVTSFDYKTAIKTWNISYIIILDQASMQRFNNDPVFSLAFKNDKVAIFKVVGI
jgi:hypothetical protein